MDKQTVVCLPISSASERSGCDRDGCRSAVATSEKCRAGIHRDYTRSHMEREVVSRLRAVFLCKKPKKFPKKC